MAAADSLRTRLEDAFWERHANPKSGWSRLLVSPLLVLACYRRDRRLLALALLVAVLNPVAFPRAAPETDTWMTRVVRAERWWLETGHDTLGLGWPNVLNTLNLPTFAATLYLAYRRRPLPAVVGLALSMALKLCWVGLIARRHRRSGDATLTSG